MSLEQGMLVEAISDNVGGETEISSLFQEALREPVNSRKYWLDGRLRELFPDRTVLETKSLSGEDHAKEHGYSFELSPDIRSEIVTVYYPAFGLYKSDQQTWRCLEWQGHPIQLVEISWKEDTCTESASWIIANSAEVAESYLTTIST